MHFHKMLANNFEHLYCLNTLNILSTENITTGLQGWIHGSKIKIFYFG